MFTTPKPNLYVSSDGFSVEVLGRTGLCYCEGERKIFVDSEVLAGPTGMCIYKSSIEKWDSPHEKQSVTDADRDKIVENIRNAFRYQGFEIHVI
jgi:hypothetical protein